MEVDRSCKIKGDIDRLIATAENLKISAQAVIRDSCKVSAKVKEILAASDALIRENAVKSRRKSGLHEAPAGGAPPGDQAPKHG
jgi:hypothetical protein